MSSLEDATKLRGEQKDGKFDGSNPTRRSDAAIFVLGADRVSGAVKSRSPVATHPHCVYDRTTNVCHGRPAQSRKRHAHVLQPPAVYDDAVARKLHREGTERGVEDGASLPEPC